MREPNDELIEAARAKGIDEDQLRSFFSDVGNMTKAEALRYIAESARAAAALNIARRITDELGSFNDVDVAGATEKHTIFIGKGKKGRRVPDPVGDYVEKKLDRG